MHVPFDPSDIKHDFLPPDMLFGEGMPFRGMPFQRGGSGLYFMGLPRQRGAGVGSVLRSLWRFLQPLVVPAVKEIGREGAAAGARVLTGVAEGHNIKDALEKETREGVSNLLRTASIKMKGSGAPKRIKRSPYIGKRVPRKRVISKKINSFGLF